MAKGSVIRFSNQEDFRFLEQAGDRDLFVLRPAIKGPGFKTLAEDDEVTFDEEKGAKGPATEHVTEF
ncbi:MAG: cold shock domain-containing protein [Thermodesulfobacteriota bacterium]|nr:cold shock domain-containing protein [Thermodesulfobacteriota bacterium]